MKLIYPEKTGALCAQMNRGLSGQDAVNEMIAVFDISHSSASENIFRGGCSSTLMARDYKSASDVIVKPVVYPGVGITSPQNGNNPQPNDPAPSLTNDSRNYLVAGGKPPRKYIVRRLTPTECAALQGMPKYWCEGLGGSDSAKYKAYGNGLALPCAYDVLNRIARFVEWEQEYNHEHI